MRAGLALLGHDPKILDIDVIQMVRLIKDGQEFKMSKRKGTAIWLVDLLEMVGKDATRYMLISKNPSSHMDFDLSVATEKNSSNPVYYAQYATARCTKLINKAKEFNLDLSVSDFNLLNEQKEKELIITLDSFNKVVETAAVNRIPSGLCEYIQIIAKQFHSYYSDSLIFDEKNLELTKQRICLVKAVHQVLKEMDGLITLSMESSGGFKNVYPFEFSIVHQIEIVENELILSYEIFNKDNDEMIFSMGHHPAFIVEPEGVITFEKEESFSSESMPGGLMVREPKSFIKIKEVKFKDLDFKGQKF
ncbi:hypothetical protein FQR65_LT15366 [Abscondita terminalis]|nr:hypothetical protein FQR65_LT15366 [Abscondita terminalis]